ncbi:MAG: prepilin-type N-terminal cleavage/methylation domain-containing protein [Planctomycetota bacterium]
MRVASRRPTRPRPAGFTLAEVLIASAILAFAAAALSQAVLSGQAHTYHALHEAKAVSLLQSTMDEVLTRPYADPDGDTTPGPDAGETDPTLFDALDDYEGLARDAGSLTDAHGRTMPAAYQRFSVAVGVEAMNTGPIGVLGTDSDGVQIKVGVTDDRGQTWTALRFVPETSLTAGSTPRSSTQPN